MSSSRWQTVRTLWELQDGRESNSCCGPRSPHRRLSRPGLRDRRGVHRPWFPGCSDRPRSCPHRAARAARHRRRAASSTSTSTCRSRFKPSATGSASAGSISSLSMRALPTARRRPPRTSQPEEFTRLMVTNALSPMRVIEALGELIDPNGTGPPPTPVCLSIFRRNQVQKPIAVWNRYLWCHPEGARRIASRRARQSTEMRRTGNRVDSERRRSDPRVRGHPTACGSRSPCCRAARGIGTGAAWAALPNICVRQSPKMRDVCHTRDTERGRQPCRRQRQDHLQIPLTHFRSSRTHRSRA